MESLEIFHAQVPQTALTKPAGYRLSVLCVHAFATFACEHHKTSAYPKAASTGSPADVAIPAVAGTQCRRPPQFSHAAAGCWPMYVYTLASFDKRFRDAPNVNGNDEPACINIQNHAGHQQKTYSM